MAVTVVGLARPREGAPPPLTRQPLFVRFWVGKNRLGCLLGALFLIASPMPRMREEDLA
jgi:hypothetical protein